MKKILMFMIPCLVLANTSILQTIPEPEYHYPAKTSFDIQREIQPDFNNKVPSVTLDRHFVGVKYSYFEKFNKWYISATHGIQNQQNNESFDCDNHALLYKSLFSISTLKKDVKRELLVGVILVEQTEHFLGIPATNRHALNVVFTEKGWVVYEPQTNMFCMFKDYLLPIKAFIF